MHQEELLLLPAQFFGLLPLKSLSLQLALHPLLELLNDGRRLHPFLYHFVQVLLEVRTLHQLLQLCDRCWRLQVLVQLPAEGGFSQFCLQLKLSFVGSVLILAPCQLCEVGDGYAQVERQQFI